MPYDVRSVSDESVDEIARPVIGSCWPMRTRTEVPGGTTRVESCAPPRIGKASATRRERVARMRHIPESAGCLLQERPRQYELGRHEVYEQSEHVHQSRDEWRRR